MPVWLQALGAVLAMLVIVLGAFWRFQAMLNAAKIELLQSRAELDLWLTRVESAVNELARRVDKLSDAPPPPNPPLPPFRQKARSHP